MSRFRPARGLVKRAWQRASIAAAYARAWRAAEPGDLGVFVAEVNQQLTGKSVTDWPMTVNPRRSTITLAAPLGDYRATLRLGALVANKKSWQSIAAKDIERLEFRRT